MSENIMFAPYLDALDSSKNEVLTQINGGNFYEK